jgi:NAD+ synthase
MSINDIIDRVKNLDYEDIKNKIVSFLKYEAKNNNKSFVIGLSGGLDSSLVAKLASLSRIDTLGLILPYSKVTPKDDIDDAITLADELNINYHIIGLDNAYEQLLSLLPKDRYASANLLARLRMCMLYYYANLNNSLVLGTGDRSEILLGYFTKYGDGACDLLPIGRLYKLQVRELAKYLSLNKKIIEKKSSPRLWEDHLAEEELGLSYEEIDCILYAIFDLKMSKEDIISIFGSKKVERVTSLHRNSNHKRIMPKLCYI